MVSPEQEAYVAYHSPEQRNRRTTAARVATDAAVSEAHRQFFSGDSDAARHVLFLAGLQDEGIDYYIALWGSESDTPRAASRLR